MQVPPYKQFITLKRVDFAPVSWKQFKQQPWSQNRLGEKSNIAQKLNDAHLLIKYIFVKLKQVFNYIFWGFVALLAPAFRLL